jgi:CheY-like chemotaxis protein
MDAATQAKIFDPFFTTKAQGEGTGLGLAIVHGIVGDHGGAIRVRSAPGEGATFEILLPLVSEPTETTAKSSAAAPMLSGVGMKVLLVDDEEPVRRFVSLALGRAGFVVESYADGLSAVRQFSAAPASYTVALLDLSMPARTGLELIGDLRALRADLPVLLMSGDHARYRPKPGDAPAYARLAKPFLIPEFFAALKQLLDKNQPASPK